MTKRCDRNRKRSKRRSIYCPKHPAVFLESSSPKYPVFADQASHLQQRGVSRKNAQLVIASNQTVTLSGEWLEAFWCNECQRVEWYHVRKQDDRYQLSLAPSELWQRVTGVTYPNFNPSVSEFTQRQSRGA